MNIGQFYFSPHGRVSRRGYWLGIMLPALTLLMVVVFLEEVIEGAPTFTLLGDELGVFSGALSLILLLPSMIVSIKRFHDLNMTGWWSLFFVPFYFWYSDIEKTVTSNIMFLVPVAGVLIFGFILSLIQLFQRGQIGENKYGPNPILKGSNPSEFD